MPTIIFKEIFILINHRGVFKASQSHLQRINFAFFITQFYFSCHSQGWLTLWSLMVFLRHREAETEYLASFLNVEPAACDNFSIELMPLRDLCNWVFLLFLSLPEFQLPSGTVLQWPTVKNCSQKETEINTEAGFLLKKSSNRKTFLG